MCSEVLELSGDAATEHKKKTIQGRHIQLAIGNDEELSKLMCAAMIAEGGVVGGINDFLKPQKKGKKNQGTQEM